MTDADRLAASAAKKATREKAKTEREDRMRHYRHGFQLAKTLGPGEAIDFENSALEVKYDGELGMIIDGRIVNRSGNDVTERFPELKASGISEVIVGEIAILDENGMAEFNKIQQRACEDKMKIRIRSQEIPATFLAFDILEVKGGSIEDQPFKVRRDILELWFKHGLAPERFQLVEQLRPKTQGEVDAMMATMAEAGGEGFMVKDLDAPYRAKRGRAWLKLKTWQDDEFTIVRHGPTGVGDGYTIFVQSGEHLQEVSMGDREMRTRARTGGKVEVKFLSRAKDGALRFPTVRRLLE